MLELGNYGPAFVGAVTALIAKPLVDWTVNRYRETQSYRAHMRDRIRDFRESIAVLDSIRLLKREIFPIDAHVAKVGIPDHLISAKNIDSAKLTPKTQAEGVKLSNQLANITLETKSILKSKSENNADAFYAQAEELGDKLRNLVATWLQSHNWVENGLASPSEDPKPIIFEDGRKLYGVSFQQEKPGTF